MTLVASLAQWTIWTVLAHPIRPGNPVDAWGGILSCLGYLTIIVSILGTAGMTYRKHECHVAGCHWPSWHTSDKYCGHPVCRKHHEHGGTAPLAAQ